MQKEIMNIDEPKKSLHYSNGFELHEAEMIIDKKCYIYKPEVVNIFKVGDIVRISFIVKPSNTLDYWRHDSPFVSIIDIVENEDEESEYHLLGKILDINRQSTNKYPLNIGDNIWFNKQNIIEIHSVFGENSSAELNEYKTQSRVLCSGPLYTIKNSLMVDSDEEESEGETEGSEIFSDDDEEDEISSSE